MRRIALVGGVLAVALIASLVARTVVADDEDPVVIVHWSNSHPARDGLLPAMVEQFNREDHETASGRPIEILLVKCESSDQVADLVARLDHTSVEGGCETAEGEPSPNPVILTPQSDDWLVGLNEEIGRDVVDVDGMKAIAETYLGIATYKDMAKCLGWPDKPFGYEDLLTMHEQGGWRAYSCYETKWESPDPLLAFTNPNTSTSGRNVLVSLYAMATGKEPADLTVSDVRSAEAVVSDFQQLVDHYMPATLQLNTKIAQGPGEGHFFLIPEDNLVNLYEGNEEALVGGTKQTLDPVTDLKMIYPKEGSVLNSNPAAIVDADWVSAEQVEGADEWIDFVRDDDQQQRFMDAGFRPADGTDVTVDAEQKERMEVWGLDPERPKTIDPGAIHADVLDEIIGSWGAVKKPAIVTLVVDLSGSMQGDKLEGVQEGLRRLVTAMSGSDSASPDSQLGLVTFDTKVGKVLAPRPIGDAKFDLSEAIESMTALGNTALYDAVKKAVEITDGAQGNPDATRAIVVLSDGAATVGDTCLDELVSMTAGEADIAKYCGMFELDGITPKDRPEDETDGVVSPEDVSGVSLRVPTDHRVQVFFVGFGDADIETGRILAEATGAQYRGKTDEDLAAVIEALSGYF